jgi:hypothetical protein
VRGSRNKIEIRTFWSCLLRQFDQMTWNKMGGASGKHGTELRIGFGWANLKERDR